MSIFGSKKTLISVVMPVYNGKNFLPQAIESILNQRYRNFEFIIIDDGSTDGSTEIIKGYAKLDKRIKVIENQERKGVVFSLTLGIEEARGEIIARMDSDDLSLPQRFECQLDYMLSKDLDLCGTFINFFRGGIKERTIYFPTSHENIRLALLFVNTFSHPTVMIRREVFDRIKYNPAYEPAEDYKFWCDLFSKSNFRAGNLPKVLLYYRKHGRQFSLERACQQREAFNKARLEYAQSLGDAVCLVRELEEIELAPNPKQVHDLLERIEHFCHEKRLSSETVYFILKEVFNRLVKKTVPLYLSYYKASRGFKRYWLEELMLFLKSFLFHFKSNP